MLCWVIQVGHYAGIDLGGLRVCGLGAVGGAVGW